MSIDPWTIGLEVVNFLVLVWLLERLLYRPVLGVIGERQAEIDRLREVDAAAEAALERERDELERERAAVAADRDRALEEAHATAREEHARAERAARAEMDRLLAAGHARLEAERAEAVRALQRKSAELGVGLARRLLAMSTPPDGDGRFIEAACARLGAMDEPERARLDGALGPGASARVVTAEALSEDARRHCRERIGTALGREIDIDFAVDESLIAGIEVHFPGLVLRHSWRDALATSEAALVARAETEAGAEAGAEAGGGDDAPHAR